MLAGLDGLMTMTNLNQPSTGCNEYLIAEFKCAASRARHEASELDATAAALRAGLIAAEQAIACAADSEYLRWIQPSAPDANWSAEGWRQAAREYHNGRQEKLAMVEAPRGWTRQQLPMRSV